MKMEECEKAGRWKGVEDERGQSCVTACFIIVFREQGEAAAYGRLGVMSADLEGRAGLS